MQRIGLIFFLVILSAVIPSHLIAQNKNQEVVYSIPVIEIRRSMNAYAVNRSLHYDDITGTLMSAATVLDKVNKYRPDYHAEYPGRFKWLKKLAASNALALLIRSPNYQGDVAAFFPEPITIDDPDIFSTGLFVTFHDSQPTETSPSRAEQPTPTGTNTPKSKKARVETEDAVETKKSKHPIFALSTSEDDDKAFDAFPVGTAWRIRAPSDATVKSEAQEKKRTQKAQEKKRTQKAQEKKRTQKAQEKKRTQKAQEKKRTQKAQEKKRTQKVTASYCHSSIIVLRVINAYAIQYELTPEKVTGEVILSGDALAYIASKNQQYLSTHPNIHTWLKKMASIEALAIRIRAPELKVDSFYFPEPFEADVPFVYRGFLLHLNEDSKNNQDTCLGYDVGPGVCLRRSGNTSCEPCPTDPEHPLFKLSIPNEDKMPFNIDALGKTWRIR